MCFKRRQVPVDAMLRRTEAFICAPYGPPAMASESSRSRHLVRVGTEADRSDRDRYGHPRSRFWRPRY